MGFAEFIIEPAEGWTRWLYPSYFLVYFRLAPGSWTGTCGEVLITLGAPSE